MSGDDKSPRYEITFERTLVHHDPWQFGIATGSAATVFQDFLLSFIAVVGGIIIGALVCLNAGWPTEIYFMSVGALVAAALIIQFGVPFVIGTFQLPIDLYLVKSGGSFLGPCTVRASSETISETKPNAQHVYNWSAILKMSRSRSGVLLFTDRIEAIFIPTDAFVSDEELNGFCAYCEENIERTKTYRS